MQYYSVSRWVDRNDREIESTWRAACSNGWMMMRRRTIRRIGATRQVNVQVHVNADCTEMNAWAAILRTLKQQQQQQVELSGEDTQAVRECGLYRHRYWCTHTLMFILLSFGTVEELRLVKIWVNFNREQNYMYYTALRIHVFEGPHNTVSTRCVPDTCSSTSRESLEDRESSPVAGRQTKGTILISVCGIGRFAGR